MACSETNSKWWLTQDQRSRASVIRSVITYSGSQKTTGHSNVDRHCSRLTFRPCSDPVFLAFTKGSFHIHNEDCPRLTVPYLMANKSKISCVSSGTRMTSMPSISAVTCSMMWSRRAGLLQIATLSEERAFREFKHPAQASSSARWWAVCSNGRDIALLLLISCFASAAGGSGRTIPDHSGIAGWHGSREGPCTRSRCRWCV